MEVFQELEYELAKWIGTEPNHVVVCSSGTAALHLAFEALELPPKSEVVMSDFNMIACPRAVTLAGLTPAFVDCDDCLLIDYLQSGKATTLYTRAMLVTHIYGRQARILEYPESQYGFQVIEDLAEAHGIKPSKWSSAACWSFYKNKIIAGEEGGAVYFRNQNHAFRARQLRSLGFTEEHDFMHIPRGHNYRLANCLAEKILTSLRVYQTRGGIISIDGKIYDSILDLRTHLEHAYESLCPIEWRMPKRQAPWVYDLRIPGLTYEKQSKIVKELNQGRIAARHAFKPMSIQPEYKNMRRVGGDNAVSSSREVIYLPLTPHRDAFKDVSRAFDIIHRVLEAE